MENEQFVARINRILSERRLTLPVIQADEAADSDAVAAWAAFLEECVRAGIHLSDPRWQRLHVVRHSPVTELALDHESSSERDEEFKLGLQLLMGLFPGRPPR